MATETPPGPGNWRRFRTRLRAVAYGERRLCPEAIDRHHNPFAAATTYPIKFCHSKTFRMERQARTFLRTLLAGEIVDRHGILEERVVAGNHGDAAIGHEVAGAVGLGVIADGGAFREMNVAVDDAAADAAMASDGDVREEDRRINLGVGIHAHIRGEHGVLDRAARYDAAVRNDGIEGGAHAIFFREDEFGRRI